MKKLKLTFSSKEEQTFAEKELIRFRFDYDLDDTSNDIMVTLDEAFEEPELLRKLERVNLFPTVSEA